MKSLILLLISLTASPAIAQQPQPQGTPEVLALQSKLMQELQGVLQCTTQFIALQQKEAQVSAENAKLRAEIESLKGKQDK